MATYRTAPKRKSAQRASELVRKQAAFSTSARDDEDSDKYEEGSEDSSSSSGGEDHDEEGEERSPSPGEDEESEGEQERLNPTRFVAYNTERSYRDLIAVPGNAKFGGLLSHLPCSRVEKREAPGRVEITVQEQILGIFSAINEKGTSIGYAGGTVTHVIWIPNSDLVCLAVCNTTHIVSYENSHSDTIQIWRYKTRELSFLYSVKLPLFTDIQLYSFHTDTDETLTVCVAARTSAQIVKLPFSPPPSDVESSHFTLVSASLQLALRHTTCSLTCVTWSVFEDRARVIGGLDNGYIVVWCVPHSSTTPDYHTTPILPVQTAPAHLGHPVLCLCVCPQRQNHFASISHDSRLKYWNLKNFSRPILVRLRGQKQLMYALRMKWCALWDRIVIHSGGSRRDSALLLTLTEIDELARRPNLYCPPTFLPPQLKGIRSCVMDFSDAYSRMAMGFRNGLAALFHIAGFWDQRRLKVRMPVATNLQYLECRAEVKDGLNIDKNFLDDQDYINHHKFQLSPSLSDTISPKLTSPGVDSEEFGKKSLVSLTSVAWSAPGGAECCACVGYMSGLFQIVTPGKAKLNIAK